MEIDYSAFDPLPERTCGRCAHSAVPEPYFDAGDVCWCTLYEDFAKASEDQDCDAWEERP